MKSVTQALKDLILQAAIAAHRSGVLPSREFPPVEIDEPKLESHGDFSTNIALISASIQKLAPRKIAQAIVAHLEPPSGLIQKTEIAGPGFINFFIDPEAWRPVLVEIHQRDAEYGASDIGRNRKVQVEFVSANPTGPLHVGHGRGAAVGDTVATILAFIGYEVQREYYINDSGRQIQTLGRSVHLRCRELLGDAISFPEDCYRGDYIIDIAKNLLVEKGRDFMAGDPEQALSVCARYAAGVILSGIRKDLDDFGVNFDRWYSEQTLYDSGTVDRMLSRLEKNGLVYEKEGARWFVSSRFGDEKDRVVVRNNGQTTYFASDIAYHQEKYDRGFDRVIDVWGADHHGYIPRMAAAVMASGRDREQFHVILIQLVNLLRGGEPVAMSSRAGEFVTLREVMDEVGRDAARFIFLTRHYDSKLDFDLELAKKKSNDNPVYYVQYVHARISSILEKAREAAVSDFGSRKSLSVLKEPEEIGLMKHLARFPEIVETAGVLLEPHRITYFLLDLAQAFHVYYNKHRVLTESPEISAGRLYLVRTIRTVIRNGLRLLGVSTPEKM